MTAKTGNSKRKRNSNRNRKNSNSKNQYRGPSASPQDDGEKPATATAPTSGIRNGIGKRGDSCLQSFYHLGL
jgi:hypothetical protein